MENFALVSLVESLKPAMVDFVIRRVIQPHSNGFILQTRSPKMPALKLLVDPLSPAVYNSEARTPAETPTTDFLMVLRKHLTSAELISFSKPLSERILDFGFKTAVPTKELETMSLIVELLPNAPNLILLDAERRVVSSFAPITPQHGIGEFEAYTYPKSGDKLSLEAFLSENPPPLSEPDGQPDSKSWLISTVAGIGPVFAGEVIHRHRKSGRPLSEEIRIVLAQVQAPSRGAYIYTELPLGHIFEQNDLKRLRKAVVSPIQLESMERGYSSRLFANIVDAVKFYFDELESRTLLDQTKLPLLRELRDAAKRFGDREKKLTREQKKYEEAEAFQKTGQLLNSSGLRMDQRYDSVTVKDYFREKPEDVFVSLDSALTLRENIDRMFKKHQKAGRGRTIVAQQIASVRNRRAQLDEKMRRLQAIKDWDTWLAIADKIDKQRGDVEAQNKPTSAHRFRSIAIEGWEVLVGRSGRENDDLTFHVASPDDFWLHVADYSGSHVVVRNPARHKELDENVLTKAAQLAAYFSQARNSSKVEVHYTRRKNVTKPRRAKPGLVRLLEFKSIKVEPKNWLVE